MHELVRKIESTRHLVVFESASRLGSFTKAAKELNVSQPAISQSVRRLEAAIGVQLFVRSHRSIRLTIAGERLAKDVTDGFERISTTIQSLSQIHHGQHVTLSVSTAFANYWMVPRLKDFHTQNPQIDIRLQTTDRELDLGSEGISLGIRRGHGNWPEYESIEIAKEVLFPVASPNFLKAYHVTEPEGMQSDIIHLEEPFRPRPSWADWYAANSLSYAGEGRGLRLNDYALVIQAAMAGEGIALGWEHIVSKILKQNLLRRIGTLEWRTGMSFYLIWTKNQPLSEDAKTVRDWIRKIAIPTL